MQQLRVPAGDPDIEAWHWLIDVIAAEIAAGSPHDPKALIARVAARMEPEKYGPYLSAMFNDPE